MEIYTFYIETNENVNRVDQPYFDFVQRELELKKLMNEVPIKVERRELSINDKERLT